MEKMEKFDAMRLAAADNNLIRIKELLNEGYDIDTHLKRKNNALWEACEHGYFELVKFLVENGADVNIYIYDISDYGCSALRNAIGGRYYDMAKYLLEKGADPDSTDLDNNHTILFDLLYRYNYGERTQEQKDIIFSFIKLLIEFKADLDVISYGRFERFEKSIKKLANKTKCKEIIDLIKSAS